MTMNNKKLIHTWTYWKDDICYNNKSSWTTADDKMLQQIDKLVYAKFYTKERK